MKIISGSEFLKTATPVKGDEVRFIAEDGQEMFQVRIGDDGRSIEIRAVDCCKVGKILYSHRLTVSPNVANQNTVSVHPYDS